MTERQRLAAWYLRDLMDMSLADQLWCDCWKYANDYMFRVRHRLRETVNLRK